MCVCVYLYMYICVYMYVYIYIFRLVCMYMFVYIFIFMCVCMYIYTYIYIYLYIIMYVSMYTHIYVYIYVFGLVSLFNGISTLCWLFNAKAILLVEEQYWYYLTHSWEDKGVHTFPKGICPKVNIIAQLEFELAYYNSAVHRFNHYTTRTPPLSMCVCIWVCIYICVCAWFGLVWFGLVGFHDISTILVFLMPNPLYTYISNIYMIC